MPYLDDHSTCPACGSPMMAEIPLIRSHSLKPDGTLGEVIATRPHHLPPYPACTNLDGCMAQFQYELIKDAANQVTQIQIISSAVGLLTTPEKV